jgi:hypothetical protein
MKVSLTYNNENRSDDELIDPALVEPTGNAEPTHRSLFCYSMIFDDIRSISLILLDSNRVRPFNRPSSAVIGGFDG